jgi:hypothetical protein
MNFNRKSLAALALVLTLVIAGCAGAVGNGNGDQLEEDTGEDFSDVDLGESFWFENKKTEQNQNDLVQNQPPEGMDRSLERQNLKDRNEYLNDQNNQHYVYLMSHGKVVAQYTAQGKVSSVNSKLTSNKQVVKSQDCIETTYKEGHGSCYKVVESPQMDGSYGTNGDGIFFFTTTGEYVEWNGEYIVSEQPMNIDTPPELTKKVNESSD